jgi:hypothetical protein
MIDCNNYIFSSNSEIHKLPNKVTIARIAKLKPGTNLLFNYPEIIENIIFNDDLESLNTLRKNGLVLKGCEETIKI